MLALAQSKGAGGAAASGQRCACGPKNPVQKKPQSFYSAMSEEEELQRRRSSSTDAEAPGVVMFVKSISPRGMKPKKAV